MRCAKWSVVFGCLVLALTAVGCGKSEEELPRVGGAAPRFSLKDRDGQIISSDSLTGQVVLLTFWSTTCGPCVHEIPDLQQLDDSHKARVIGIALNPEGWSAVQPFVEKHQVRYSVVLGDEALFERSGGYSLPHSLLLDRTQRIVKIYRGAVTRESVEKDIEALGNGS